MSMYGMFSMPGFLFSMQLMMMQTARNLTFFTRVQRVNLAFFHRNITYYLELIELLCEFLAYLREFSRVKFFNCAISRGFCKNSNLKLLNRSVDALGCNLRRFPHDTKKS